MWDLKELEELEAEINEREETEIYKRACVWFLMAVSALFGGVMTLFILAVSQHLK